MALTDPRQVRERRGLQVGSLCSGPGEGERCLGPRLQYVKSSSWPP